MPHTPPWYPAKAASPIDDEADTVEVLSLSIDNIGKAMRLQTTVTCPSCGAHKEEIMPVDRGVDFYECTHCHKVLQPIFGDCCVYCSYGTVICPNEQRRELEDASQSI